jgi:hypothetical protein
MSFFAKLTSIFSTSSPSKPEKKPTEHPKLELVLQKIITPALKFDIKIGADTVANFLYESEGLPKRLFTV